MDFSLLGPVEAQEDGQPIPLGGPRQRALLARLLVDANRAVSVERLAADLWDAPPQDAHGALQNQVSRLRKVLGDRLALFKNLAAQGPATSDELASRAGITERYAREWLSALACAGYLEYDPASHRFTLPPEHAPALADELGPQFLGGCYQQLPATVAVLDQLTQAFRQGGGVPQAASTISITSAARAFARAADPRPVSLRAAG